jgi:hypothetical protein
MKQSYRLKLCQLQKITNVLFESYCQAFLRFYVIRFLRISRIRCMPKANQMLSYPSGIEL